MYCGENSLLDFFLFRIPGAKVHKDITKTKYLLSHLQRYKGIIVYEENLLKTYCNTQSI